MKITCNTKDLSAAVALCASAASGQLPITKGVLLEAADGIVTVTGFDLSIGVSSVTEAKVLETGAVVIDAKMLSDILKKLPGDVVNLHADQNNLVQIESGGADYSLMGMKAEDYPELPEIGEDSPITLTAETLKAMIRQTIFAVKTDNTVHSGVKFEIHGSKLSLIAVDGFRMAIRTENIRDCGEAASFVVPAKALNEVLKLDGEDILIYRQETKVRFASDRNTVFSNLLYGDFLDYKRAIPQNYPTMADAQKETLIRAIERVSVIITEKAQVPLRCEFSDGTLQISAQTTMGTAQESVAVEVNGDPVTVGYNHRFLLDTLKALDTDEARLHIGGAAAPLVIRDTDSAFTYLILPVRLKEGE